MALTGPIAAATAAELPRTWEALLRASSYGESQLQYRINWAKWTVFNTVIDPNLETTSYNFPEIMLAAKVAALSIIPGAIDYWGDQYLSETTSGTNESRTYPDRRDGLYRIQQRLLQEIGELEEQVAYFLGRRPTRRVSLPAISTDGQTFRTADPNLFPAYEFLTAGSAASYMWEPVK